MSKPLGYINWYVSGSVPVYDDDLHEGDDPAEFSADSLLQLVGHRLLDGLDIEWEARR